MSNRYYRSRWQRREAGQNIRRTVVFILLTIALGFIIIFLGVPLLIKMAVFIGDLRSSSEPIETKENIPPSPPRLKPLFEATSSATITLSGFSESGATIEIFLNGSSNQKVIAESNGSFNANNINLNQGRNLIWAKATDTSGNTSPDSEKISIDYDNSPPSLEIFEPAAEISISKQNVTVKGKTESEAEVNINGRVVIITGEGNFETTINLSQGENLIKIIAQDKAGNKTEKEIKITFSP